MEWIPDWLVSWLGTVTLFDAVLWIGGAVGGIALLRKGWPWLRNTARAILHFGEIVDAARDLPEFMERTTTTLAEQSDQIKDIHHEVHFNNGSSVKDAVVRVENDVKTLLQKETP